MDIHNIIKKYDDMVYDSRLTKFSELTSNKYNNVHKQLYNDALCKYLSENNIDKSKFFLENKVIEQKGDEYWMPSKIIVISKTYDNGYSKQVIDLAPYWNHTQDNAEYDYNDIKIHKSDYNDSEIIYIDYVAGTVAMRSKTTGDIQHVDFKYIDGNTPVSDEYTLKETFTYMFKNR
jgi:hypothetical protein